MLDLDEALDSELVRAREMVVEVEQPELGPVRLLGHPGEALAHARRPDPPGARRSASTPRRCSREAGLADDEIAALLDSGAAAGLNARARGRQPFLAMSATDASSEPPQADAQSSRSWPRSRRRHGASHYLREGLLPEPVKTSRNMAYYPPEFVERIRLIKQLQEERFMPLRVIRDLLDAATPIPSGCGR